MSKVTVVGAGNVGATCANVLAVNEVANEVCLIDIKEGFAEGKAMDIMQTAQLMGFDTVVTGVTNDYSKTSGSDVVIITSGLPRKPGMTREELIGVNAGIVKSVCDQVLKYSPNAILVVVSNPMDTMAYLTLHALKLPRNRVIGFVIGGHGDTTMIPLTSYTTYKGINVSEFLSAEELENVVKSTMVGGATLTGLLGTSAWMAPGAAAASVAEAIIKDQKKMIPCSAALEGEYGMKDITIGVPCIIGKNGIEKILELNISEEERAKLHESEAAVRKTTAILKELNVL